MAVLKDRGLGFLIGEGGFCSKDSCITLLEAPDKFKSVLRTPENACKHWRPLEVPAGSLWALIMVSS